MSINDFFRNKALISAASLLCLSAAMGSATAKTIDGRNETPTISWRLLPRDEYDGRCILRYTVNHADSIDRLFFTQLPRPYRAISEGDSIGEINAGYYFLNRLLLYGYALL
ncbi:MAG: hypothetical protein K2H72_09350, partial [Muribaculaceae bacterium]|nr:hypothetical protein [Muribaculaceae bacterium]